MSDYNIFNIYKNKIINSPTYTEALTLLEEALSKTDNLIEQKILKSLVNENRYKRKMEYDKFIIYLNIIETIYYYNDAITIIEDIASQTEDTVQMNTLRKLVARKPYRQNVFINNNQNKNCPHCNKKNTGNITTNYIICGYGNKGFDWKGCGKDWCFFCGKKLCKMWNTDMLFNLLNRHHDSKCCKNYALKINDSYPENYCQCTNSNVNRLKL